MSDKPKVMYDSPEAAQVKTVTGWVSRLGHFYGDNEHIARYDGCTHVLCKKCGAERDIRGYCRPCYDKDRLGVYEKMEFKEWDGKTPLVLFDDDRYFWDEDAVFDHCDNFDVSPEDLDLVICEPQYASEIDDDHFIDDLPEDQGLDEVYPELADLIEKVNELIRKKEKPLSWTAGRYRTEVKRGEAS
jgi:hypothetical protein